MLLWRRFASLSIYPKLFLTFLVVLSPLYLISWRMNAAGSQTVEREISASLKSRTSLYMDILESDLDRVIDLIQTYANDNDLVKLSTSSEVMTEIEKMQSQLQLKSRLDLLKRNSTFIENANAYIPAMNRIVSSNANIFTTFDRDMFQALSRTTNRFESPIIVYKERLFISMPSADPIVSSGRPPVFLITVELDKKKLAAALRHYTSDGGGAFLVGNDLRWSISGVRSEQNADLLAEAQRSRPERAQEENPASLRSVMVKDVNYLVVSQSSSRLGMTLYMYVPGAAVTAPLDAYQSWFTVLSVASVFLVLLFSYSIYLIIQQPLKTLIRSFRRVEQGRFDQELSYPFKDEFGYLYDQFNGMLRRLDVLVHEVYEQQFRARLAELRHLQSQINPHFLYNSYFILYRMAMLHDNDNVIYFTKHLGEYFQYITRDGAEEVPLESEVKHARTYAEIQSVRFSDRIRVEFGELPPEAAGIPVPRLILQPLIENCYSHGMENKRRGGFINVGFDCPQGSVVITVEDNGGEMNEAKLQELRELLQHYDEAAESTGLLNVHRRIQIRYGAAYGIGLELGGQGGLKVTMTIPREEERAHAAIADRG